MCERERKKAGEQMNIEQAETVLGAELSIDRLRALTPDRTPYGLVLLQPEGPIEGSTNRVGHADSARAAEVCRTFLELALQTSCSSSPSAGLARA